MQRSVNLPRLHNASGALTVSEADLMKSFAQLANMKEDAFKIMDNKMKAEEKEIYDQMQCRAKITTNSSKS